MTEEKMRACTLPILMLALICLGVRVLNIQARDVPAEGSKVPEVVRKELGEKTVAIISEAKRVEVFRLKDGPVPKGAE
jgi:hypothetical protein